jgi:hypothetical protein
MTHLELTDEQTEALIRDRRKWWSVIGYEVSMFRGLLGLRGQIFIQSEDDPQSSVCLVGNIITESKVLHTRNLCDFCTSPRPDDIRPSDLFDNYDTDQKYETLIGLMKRLSQHYGKGEGSSRWAFNKKLAHPTKERAESFNYTPFLDRVVPVLLEIIREIETLRGPFPELPNI